jgi:hypothetical protein
LLQDVPCSPGLEPHGPNRHRPVLIGTAIVWNAVMSGAIATGAEDGAGTIEIGIMAQEVQARAGMVAGVGTVVTDMGRDFGSEAARRA